MQAVNVYTTNRRNPITGYGKLERGLIQGLASIGVVPILIGPEEQPVLQAASVTILTALPRHAQHCPPGKVVLYTMSESTKVSPAFVAAINATCQAVLVPCPGLIDIYRQSGVTVPIFDVGMGVDYYLPETLPSSPLRRGPDDQYVFLTYSIADIRKGAHLAVQAFRTVFHNQPHIKLWIKARDGHGTWLDDIEDSQIRVLHNQLTEGEWFALLKAADCFVFPSYGEGFGLPPREAVLAGTPAIVTQWLGMWDADEWALPIPVRRMLPAHFDVWEANAPDGLWAEADLTTLTGYMETAPQLPLQDRHKARIGKRYLLRHFTWQKTAERIMEAMQWL